ncbi:MAG: MotA/TolQ/ExbB proton channel family protein [Candidatus Competibacteraceae bacterium]|nr:MotA/TolQ/ExbB proton channel family protein [Candidatus Competibacteraceae bacterium]
MKKLFSLIAIFCTLSIGSTLFVFAQDNPVDTSAGAVTEAPTEATPETPATVKEVGFRQQIKDKFIEGGYEFMVPILLVLILGIALSIERIIFLNMSAVNTGKLLQKIEGALNAGGVEEAKNVCRATSGPVAGVFLEGLNRTDEGIEIVEKSIVSYGGVEMSKMEKGISWLNLCIALAPMLGFLGTVIGMILAFDAIEAAGDISPSIVAGGMKVALITTVFGLIVAIILQVFYNYIISKIDGLVGSMEEASIDFIDILVKKGVGVKK